MSSPSKKDAIDASIARVESARIQQNVVIASTSTPEKQRVVSLNVPADLTDAELIEFAGWLLVQFAPALRERNASPASRIVAVHGGLVQ